MLRTNAATPADARTFRDMGLEAAIFVCLRRALMAESICGCLGDAQVTVVSDWTGEEGRGGGGGGGLSPAYARVCCVWLCCQLKLWLWAWPLALEALLLFFSNATPKRSVWGWFYTSEAGMVG